LKRRVRTWVIILGLTSALAGCDYSSSEPPPLATDPTYEPTLPSAPTKGEASAISDLTASNPEMKAVILESVINLIKTAALQPGGDNFMQATAKLNNYFEGTAPAEYALKPAAREYLASQMPTPLVKSLERPSFELIDARHLEDCMLYHGIATRVAGNGDDLTRVRRLFDWMVRQVQLVPPESLAEPQIGQAQARPYDVLLRGMATESIGGWSERGWLFMSLCRQLGIDVGLLTYTPAGEKDPVSWICAALIDQKLYLFDPRIGLAVPGPDGTGVATLDEALSNPVILDRLDLPGQSGYRTTAAALAKSPSKIGLMIDSSPGYLSPRMLLLQNSLVGQNRTVLYRDPADQRDKFVQALGAHSGGVSLWPLPIMVETRLFTDPKFVQATQHVLYLFGPQFPLLYARTKQLRGELAEAVTDYMSFRFNENATMVNNKKQQIPAEERNALDLYATYFLGLCHLDRENPGQAEFFFRQTLRLMPAPGPGQPYFHMFRWGAQTNLGLLQQAKGDDTSAIGYYSEFDPTPQHHGNMYQARELVWRNPTAAPPMPLPPPPMADAGLGR
jgi:hypothetical protein